MRPFYSEKGITIYNGNALEVLPTLPPVDLVLTDPPYGVDFKYEDSYTDSKSGYADLVSVAFAEMRRVSEVTALTTGMRNLWLYPPADWVMCWAKPGSTRQSGLGGFNCWEPVLVYGKPVKRVYQDFRLLPTAANLSKDFAGEHPCPKPLKLYKWLIDELSNEGDTVLDPFMGSGTTLRAAKDLGREAIGIEIEEKYCEIAARRLSQGVLEFV